MFSRKPQRPSLCHQDDGVRGHYHESRVGIGIVVGQVANILSVREGGHKGEGVKALPRGSACSCCVLLVMISEKEEKAG
jgi:hypothetical protein